MDALFIPDGYTVTVTIPAAPGLHPEVTIVYRPATAMTRVKYGRALTDDAATMALVADQVQTWAVPGSPAVKLDASQVAKVPGELYTKILNYVLGFAAPDVRIEDAEKNSPRG